jgi:predicted GTPase
MGGGVGASPPTWCSCRSIFNDHNEPFWRSAKHMELGPIPAAEFERFIQRRFTATGKSIDRDTAEAVVAITGGHPYGTQELAYALWQATARRHRHP